MAVTLGSPPVEVNAQLCLKVLSQKEVLSADNSVGKLIIVLKSIFSLLITYEFS